MSPFQSRRAALSHEPKTPAPSPAPSPQKAPASGDNFQRIAPLPANLPSLAEAFRKLHLDHANVASQESAQLARRLNDRRVLQIASDLLGTMGAITHQALPADANRALLTALVAATHPDMIDDSELQVAGKALVTEFEGIVDALALLEQIAPTAEDEARLAHLLSELTRFGEAVEAAKRRQEVGLIGRLVVSLAGDMNALQQSPNPADWRVAKQFATKQLELLQRVTELAGQAAVTRINDSMWLLQPMLWPMNHARRMHQLALDPNFRLRLNPNDDEAYWQRLSDNVRQGDTSMLKLHLETIATHLRHLSGGAPDPASDRLFELLKDNGKAIDTGEVDAQQLVEQLPQLWRQIRAGTLRIANAHFATLTRSAKEFVKTNELRVISADSLALTDSFIAGLAQNPRAYNVDPAALRTEDGCRRLFNSAVIKLVSQAEPLTDATAPETLAFDLAELAFKQPEIARLRRMATFLAIYKVAIERQGVAASADELLKFAAQLRETLEQSATADELKNCLQIVARAVQERPGAKKLTPPNPLDMQRGGSIGAAFVQDALLAYANNGAPPSFLEIPNSAIGPLVPELRQMSDRLARILMLNWETFGETYLRMFRHAQCAELWNALRAGSDALSAPLPALLSPYQTDIQQIVEKEQKLSHLAALLQFYSRRIFFESPLFVPVGEIAMAPVMPDLNEFIAANHLVEGYLAGDMTLDTAKQVIIAGLESTLGHPIEDKLKTQILLMGTETTPDNLEVVIAGLESTLGHAIEDKWKKPILRLAAETNKGLEKMHLEVVAAAHEFARSGSLPSAVERHPALGALANEIKSSGKTISKLIDTMVPVIQPGSLAALTISQLPQSPRSGFDI